MVTVRDRISEMDDFQVIRFLQHFGDQLFSGVTVPLDQIKDGVPETTRALAGFTQLENLTADEAELLLEPSVSAKIARNLLLNLAQDDEFAPLIESSLDSYSDDELVADVILALGFVSSFILVAATMEFEGEILGIKFKKSKADADLVRAITEPLANVLSGMLKS